MKNIPDPTKRRNTIHCQYKASVFLFIHSITETNKYNAKNPNIHA